MTKEMFEEITAWQKQVFANATAGSAAAHLMEESKELWEEVTNENGIGENAFEKHIAILHEYADCFLLLFGSASLYGLSYEDICRVINDKMEINKQRKWGEVNDQGYVKHVE
jgi:NTP pyrophosphatase (non-canonical NTP hydrolase)